MKVLILEDELLAQAKLAAMLQSLDDTVEIQGKLTSVKDAVQWLTKNPPPNVAFVDIQLSDDHAFEIFRRVPVQFPVIFTTAYDRYLLESFEFNAIDYLLKPITIEKLKRSLSKLKKLEQYFIEGNIMKLVNESTEPKIQERIIVKKGTEFMGLDLENIAYFFTDHRIVFVKDFNGKQFVTDKNLSETEPGLNKKKFFRVNRKFIVNIKAIEKFKSDNGKIEIFLKPPWKEDVHVSKETAPDFRKWIGVD